MEPDIPIVIAAYNRPDSLRRLLGSIEKADYSGYFDITLIISIDHSGDDTCEEIAKQFKWIYGNKKIIICGENLGLKKHIIQCGDLSVNFDAIILLEDDLFVATGFYHYSIQAYRFYKDDKRIAGIGLYNYRYNEFANCPFEPIQDNFDNYFLQVPCSWGQLWTGQHWKDFSSYNNSMQGFGENLLIPEKALLWPVKTSWKRLFFRYIIETNKYFVYPRVSLTTNFGDIGKHYDASVLIWQSPLLQGNKNFSFSTLENSLSIYDAFFELDGSVYNKMFNDNMDVSFDLNGIKPLTKIKTRFLISSKKSVSSIAVFQSELYPYENNVVNKLYSNDNTNKCFSLGESNSFLNELQFNRINVDINRTFMHKNVLADSYRAEILESTTYKIGKLILRPFVFLKNLFN